VLAQGPIGEVLTSELLSEAFGAELVLKRGNGRWRWAAET
jgi:hypothetical protein